MTCLVGYMTCLVPPLPSGVLIIIQLHEFFFFKLQVKLQKVRVSGLSTAGGNPPCGFLGLSTDLTWSINPSPATLCPCCVARAADNMVKQT